MSMRNSGRRLLQRRNFSKEYGVSQLTSPTGETWEPVDLVDSISDYVIGQESAKKEVAVAVRERWRRLQLPAEKSVEIVPKNVLIQGPSGCGKTEIMRRVSAKLQAPFVKVDASTFTRTGFVGASVNEIIVGLYDAADKMCKESFDKSQDALCKAIALDILTECAYLEITRRCPPQAPQPAKNVTLPVPDILKNFAKKGEDVYVVANGQALPAGDAVRELSVYDTRDSTGSSSDSKPHKFNPALDEIEGHTPEEIFKMPEAEAKALLKKHLTKLQEDPQKPTLSFAELKRPITSEPGLSEDKITINALQSSENVSSFPQLLLGIDAGDSSALCAGSVADLLISVGKRVSAELKAYKFSFERSPVKQLVENWGIVCIDEIDKVVHKKNSDQNTKFVADVQKELLTLIEGTVIDIGRARDERNMSLKIAGPKSEERQTIDTTHILFVCAGAFATAKPSDMMVELLGRLPVRVKVNALSEDDLYRILAKSKYPMIQQQTDLLKTEDITLEWEDDAVRAIAHAGFTINDTTQNTGARVLGSLLRAVLSDYGYDTAKYKGTTVTITKEIVLEKTKDLMARKPLVSHCI